MVLVGDWAEDGIRLNQLDLGGQELVGIVGGHACGVLTDHGRRRLAIDIHGHGGFVDRRQALGDDYGGHDASEDEAEDLPFVAPKDPEIVGEGDGGLIGRLGVVTVPRGLDGLIGGWKGSWFRHMVGCWLAQMFSGKRRWRPHPSCRPKAELFPWRPRSCGSACSRARTECRSRAGACRGLYAPGFAEEGWRSRSCCRCLRGGRYRLLWRHS